MTDGKPESLGDRGIVISALEEEGWMDTHRGLEGGRLPLILNLLDGEGWWDLVWR